VRLRRGQPGRRPVARDQALQVATSGNLGPALDPQREQQYELERENEWLMDGGPVLVDALDDHEKHLEMHSRLFSTPWLRRPQLAEKLGMQNAPAIMQNVQEHIMETCSKSANQAGSQATNAGAQPGQQQTQPSKALGHTPMPTNGAANPQAQAATQASGTHMPSQPDNLVLRRCRVRRSRHPQ
jgi:hypothetical protein